MQDYGKGKSHFALVTANYFKKQLETPEVEGILNQIKIALGNNQGILEDLTTYKRRNQKHLVICISGDSGIDLRQIFLKALRQTLELEGITDSLAQQFCQKPLAYLKQLTQTQIAQANNYLESINYQGDINSIIDLLDQENYKVITTVKEISSELNNGFPIDFETDLSIEKILQELIDNLGKGEDAKYSGILILFDELNYYLKSWATDSTMAGGASLQGITNICENNKGKIALVCFTQIRPLKSLPNQSLEDYKKLASRLEITETIYEPIASLELVIKGLLDQQINPNLWNIFFKTWNETLLADSRKAHEKRIIIYQERGWNLEDFNNNITLGCFPLHPLNSYLLCNLDFTQGRTAIQYIKEDVKKFINSQDVELNNKLNYLPAISLVDAFASNFSQPEFTRHYSEYQKAFDTISASISDNEKAILKGLFLYYVSQNKLNKPESEKHDLILSELTGLSESETKNTLDKLTQERQVIHYNEGDKTYRFYSGSNLLEIRQEIEEEASKQIERLSVNLAVKHCNEKIETYCQSKTVYGHNFINKNQLLNDEWFFEYKFYNVEEFKQALNGYKTLENTKGKGLFAYVLADNIDELNNLRLDIDKLLTISRNKEHFAVAIPSQPVNDIYKDVDNICFNLLMVDIMRRKSTTEKQDSGTAFAQLSKQIYQKVEREIKQILAPNNCNYYCLNLQELNNHQQKNPSSIVSHLLKQLYRFVPPLANNDKMALKSSTGNTIIGYTSNRLLENDLHPNKFPNQSYNTLINQVFVNSWGLFKTISQKYSVQVPTNNNNILKAWEKIDELTALDNKQRKLSPINKIWEELSKPPFGYNEYTFTMLFSAWIAYHRSEVILKGSFGLPKKRNAPSIEEKPIKHWVQTNVFDKPKDFVNKWILGTNSSPQIIRFKPITCPEIPATLSFSKAKKIIEEIDNFINSADPDQTKVEEITPKREQLLTEIEKIEDWFKPVEKAESLFKNEDNLNNENQITIDRLIELYPRLQQTLSKKINLVQINQEPLNNIRVNPTKKQEQLQNDALEKVQEKIDELVVQLSEKSESLTTEEEYGGYKVELQTTIDKITSVSLPEHLIETLNYSLQVATTKLDEIKRQAEIKDCLDKIEIFYKSLSDNASQEDYIKAINEIKKLTANLQIVQKDERYQEIVKNIENQFQNLDTTLKIWSEKLTDISKDEALKLSQEVSQQQNRFTNPESVQKVQKILNQLNSIILEIKDEEEAEKIKQQQDVDTMQKLRQNNSKLLNSFNLCQQGIAQINQLRNQLNFPDRFKTEIENLIDNISGTISAQEKEIEDLKVKLTNVKDNQGLNSLQDNLAKLKLFYQDSNYDLTCQEVQQEIEALRNLFQITKSSKSKTIESYQNQLQQLTDSYNSLNNPSDNLKAKYEQNKGNLEEKIQQIESQNKADAKQWIDSLNEKFKQIQQETAYEKLNLVDDLLKSINNYQLVNFNYLSDSEKSLLEKIQTQCIDIQTQNNENQIITLFTKLSLERKQKLYEKLEQYLTQEEEIDE